MARRLGRRPPAVALVLVLLGCATEPARRPPELGSVAADRAAALVERWEEAWRAFAGLRAAVELRVVRNGRTQRTAGVLLLSSTHLRFEAVAPLGLPSLVLTAGPERVLVWNPFERRAWSAPATPAAMHRWLGLPVHPVTLIRLLTGQPPFPAGQAVVRVVEDEGLPHLIMEDGPLRQRIWVSPLGTPARVLVENGDRLTVLFDRTVQNQLVSLTLEVPRRDLEATVRYISAEAVAPPPEAFEIRLPAGVVVQPVD